MELNPHMASILIRQHYTVLSDEEKKQCVCCVINDAKYAYQSLNCAGTKFMDKKLLLTIITCIMNDEVFRLKLINSNSINKYLGHKIFLIANFLSADELYCWMDRYRNLIIEKDFKKYKDMFNEKQYRLFESYLVMNAIVGKQ